MSLRDESGRPDVVDLPQLDLKSVIQAMGSPLLSMHPSWYEGMEHQVLVKKILDSSIDEMVLHDALSSEFPWLRQMSGELGIEGWPCHLLILPVEKLVTFAVLTGCWIASRSLRCAVTRREHRLVTQALGHQVYEFVIRRSEFIGADLANVTVSLDDATADAVRAEILRLGCQALHCCLVRYAPEIHFRILSRLPKVDIATSHAAHRRQLEGAFEAYPYAIQRIYLETLAK